MTAANIEEMRTRLEETRTNRCTGEGWCLREKESSPEKGKPSELIVL